MGRTVEKKTITGDPMQLCCPKCNGTEFRHYIQNIPAAPFIPDYGMASFIPYQWYVCVKCGWDTGIPPVVNSKRDFNKLVEWSKAKALDSLRKCSFGYQPTQEDLETTFKVYEGN